MTMTNNISNDHEDSLGISAAEPHEALADAASKRDYAVGFRKPPTKSQFQKGKSGNPKGRAKAETISDVAPLIESIFAESVKVREGEHIRTMSNLEAMLHAQLGLALKGKPAAIRKIFELAKKANLFRKAEQKSFLELTEPDGEDGKIIRAYHAEKAHQAAATAFAEQDADPISSDEHQ
jgi:hypothetical protein